MIRVDKKTIAILTKLFSLSLFAYCLSFISNIVLTSFYLPEEFGYYVAIFTVITIFQPISTLGYEGGIVTIKKAEEAELLTKLCILTAVLLCGVILVISQNILFALICLFYSINIALQSLANRKHMLSFLGLLRVQEVLFFFFFAVIISYSNFESPLLLAVMLNYLFLSSILAYYVLNNFKMPKLTTFKGLARKYTEWPKFFLISNVLNLAAANIHITMIALFYGTELAGLTSFAQKFTQLPYYLFGLAIAQVLHSKIVNCKNVGDQFFLYKKSFKYLVLLAFIVFILGYNFPRTMFEKIIPTSWHASYDIIKIILIWGVGQLIGSTLSVFYSHNSKLKVFLLLNIFNLLITLLLLSFAFVFDIAGNQFLISLSWVKFFFYMIMAILPYHFLRDNGFKYLTINFLDLEEVSYRELVKNAINYTPFHSYDWLYCLSKSNPSYELKLRCLYKNDELIAALPYSDLKKAPLFMISGIYNTYGGYVFKPHFDCNQFSYPIKLFSSLEFYQGIDGLHLYIKQNHSTFILDIKRPYEEVFAGIHSKTRNQIRKSLKSGIEIKRLAGNADIEACVDLYNQLKIKHNISKSYSDSFIYTILQRSLKNESDIKTFISVFEGRVIAFAVFLFSETQIFYFMSSFDKNYSVHNPINGILGKIIEECCNKSISNLNFGSIPIGSEKLMHFKERWGAVEYKTERYNSFAWHLFNCIRRVIR